MILWAEDSPADRRLVQLALGEMDVAPQVRFEADPRQLLRVASRVAPDLIILDINMPGLDGIETLRRLRQMPALHGTPIVMFTSLGDARNRRDCLELGADAFFTKPLNLDEFVGAVSRLIHTFGTRAPALRHQMSAQ
ncbi:MAG TPA: response regulator [Candidatus Thermoplasmatota archaeon]|nr:response regulator [Candidatus Thermoplasmatota archaeon]